MELKWNAPLPRSTRFQSILLGLLFTLEALLHPACNPPATVDLAASDLDVKITVIDTDKNPSDHKVPIVMQFFTNGKFVQLASNATVTCNGVALSWNGLGYAQRVPIVATGGAYSCRHQRNNVTATANATVPARPVITSPTPGATVTRSNSLTIAYQPDGGTGVRGGAGDGSTGLSGNVQADNGFFTGFDVSTLKAGPGTVSITREFTFTPPSGGFKSVEVKYSAGSDVNVTWN